MYSQAVLLAVELGNHGVALAGGGDVVQVGQHGAARGVAQQLGDVALERPDDACKSVDEIFDSIWRDVRLKRCDFKRAQPDRWCSSSAEWPLKERRMPATIRRTLRVAEGNAVRSTSLARQRWCGRSAGEAAALARPQRWRGHSAGEAAALARPLHGMARERARDAVLSANTR